MRVLHIVYSLIRGGTEGQCARVAIGLARRGCEQRVAVFRREGFFLSSVEAVCGPVCEIRIRHLIRIATYTRVRALARHIKEAGVHLVHCWDADAAIFGAMAARIAKVPFVTSRRDLGEIYPPHKLWLMSRADARASAVVVNAEAIGGRLVDQGLDRAKIFRIPNVLDVEEFDLLARGAATGCDDLQEGAQIIVSLARLDPEKDVGLLIDAFSKIADRHSSAFLVIVGDGPERGRLEALAGGCGLLGRVRFLGDVDHIEPIVKRCAVGVLVPRRNEGMSNAILEYEAAGIPVIATDCGGNRELLDNERCGRIVPPGDAGAVARTLDWMLSHDVETRKMGAAGRRRVESLHEVGVVLNEFQRLYGEVCGV